MTDYGHAMIVIAVMGLAVLATRIVPVLIFGSGEKVPEFILYLGRVVPYTAMGLLIVYCLRDVPVFEAPHGLPGARCLFADIAPNDFADVPEMCGLLSGLCALLSITEFHSGGLCAAVHAHHIPAPVVLFLQQAGPSAKRAILQQKLRV